jgi:hypothetical protein
MTVRRAEQSAGVISRASDGVGGVWLKCPQAMERFRTQNADPSPREQYEVGGHGVVGKDTGS